VTTALLAPLPPLLLVLFCYIWLQALAKAEDELLLLWSSVQKEQAAGLELRQQQQRTAANGTAALAGGRNSPALHVANGQGANHQHSSSQQQQQQQDGLEAAAGPEFSPAPAPGELFTIGDDDSDENLKHNNSGGAVAAAAAKTGADAHDSQEAAEALAAGVPAADSPDASRRQTHSSTDEDGEQQQQQRSPRRKQQQQQQQWPLADDSQSEQLLSRYYQRSTMEGASMPSSRVRNSSSIAQQLGRFTDWVRSWLRPAQQQEGSGLPQQQQQQWQQCEPGQEASCFGTLWAMLADVAAVVKGPERAAFAIAAALAVFDQVGVQGWRQL
jgi:hypothetical protein